MLLSMAPKLCPCFAFIEIGNIDVVTIANDIFLLKQITVPSSGIKLFEMVYGIRMIHKE